MSERDRLETYRRKRSAQTTPEPFGVPATPETESRLFVVQQHAASRMHFDLRLELDGVLLSWAVPKGPTLDPVEKRLAVATEEHPLDYADFEGIIPQGNYGAGAVIVFDRGRWQSIGDPAQGLEDGKLLFDLWGYKLRGRFTLFRIKDGPNNWILMKKPDAYADPRASLAPESIYSGLTVEQLRDGADPAARIRERLRKARVPRGTPDVTVLAPMLAQPESEPFSRDGWWFEVKYDGYRLLGAVEEGRAYLRYRRGQDVTERFPEIDRALARLPFSSFVVDGEVVVLDALGKPSFQLLQNRVHNVRPADVARATVKLPATYYVFDLIALEGHDLRNRPLSERKAFLRDVLPPTGPVRFSEHFEREGETLYRQVVEMGLEGIVAKRADSTYRSERSSDWRKVRADRVGSFAVVGFTEPKRGRRGLGALHLAARGAGELVYAGRVGTGFDDRTLDELRGRLEAEEPAEPPPGAPASSAGSTWVRPELVVEVRFKEWTGAGTLRHPVFERLRDDLDPTACDASPASPSASAPAPAEEPPPGPTVSFTNLGKTFWPEEGHTKGDLIEYYRAVSPWLLPYLADRPVVLTRYPDGIHGKSFYQKDAPGYIPEWIRTETLWSEHAEREIHYFVVEDEATLLYLANLATIPLHLWSSRLKTLQTPDWTILDLDPKGAPLADVIRIARKVHALCREIDLPAFVKSSGSTGLHVLIALGRQCTWEQSRALAEVLARVVAKELPDIATLTRTVQAREGKVYLDYLQNGHGRLLVAPFSLRPLPGAPVSYPLPWSAVRKGFAIEDYNLSNVPARLRRRRKDPWKGLMGLRPDLPAALDLLRRRVEG